MASMSENHSGTNNSPTASPLKLQNGIYRANETGMTTVNKASEVSPGALPFSGMSIPFQSMPEQLYQTFDNE